MPKETSGIQTPENLENVAKQLVDIAELLRAGAFAMRHAGFSELKIGNRSSFEIGISNLTKYSGVVQTTVVTAKSERGDFYQVDPGKPEKKATKKKSK